jgi:hypothetical protein
MKIIKKETLALDYFSKNLTGLLINSSVAIPLDHQAIFGIISKTNISRFGREKKTVRILFLYQFLWDMHQSTRKIISFKKLMSLSLDFTNDFYKDPHQDILENCLAHKATDNA